MLTTSSSTRQRAAGRPHQRKPGLYRSESGQILGVRSAVRAGMVGWSPTIDRSCSRSPTSTCCRSGRQAVAARLGGGANSGGNQIKGAIIESKSGREAIYAKVVIDSTGEATSSPWPARLRERHRGRDIHSSVNVAFRFGGVGHGPLHQFRQEHPEEFEAIMARGAEQGVRDRPTHEPRNDV